MTDSEKLDLILSEMQGIKPEMQSIKSEMQNMKSEMQNMKSEMQNMKSEIQNMKSEMQDMKSEIQDLNRRVRGIELHIENGTDKNIQIIAENFIELTNKLNLTIPAADKNLAYEGKVNYLAIEFDKLKKEVAEIKRKIAIA